MLKLIIHIDPKYDPYMYRSRSNFMIGDDSPIHVDLDLCVHITITEVSRPRVDNFVYFVST